jgi:hypothetical protein
VSAAEANGQNGAVRAAVSAAAAEPAAEEPADFQISFTSNKNEEIIDELKSLDVNTLTPIEAMTRLYDLSNKAKEG